MRSSQFRSSQLRADCAERDGHWRGRQRVPMTLEPVSGTNLRSGRRASHLRLFRFRPIPRLGDSSGAMTTKHNHRLRDQAIRGATRVVETTQRALLSKTSPLKAEPSEASPDRGGHGDLQEQLLRFEGAYSSRLMAAFRPLTRVGPPDVRLQAMTDQLAYLSAALDIATGGSPVLDLLDMVTLVALGRDAMASYWKANAEPDRARDIEAAFDASLEDIRAVVRGALPPTWRRSCSPSSTNGRRNIRTNGRSSSSVCRITRRPSLRRAMRSRRGPRGSSPSSDASQAPPTTPSCSAAGRSSPPNGFRFSSGCRCSSPQRTLCRGLSGPWPRPPVTRFLACRAR